MYASHSNFTTLIDLEKMVITLPMEYIYQKFVAQASVVILDL